ncbi:MAG: NAD(P)(+) transhydrogenase (Re/Si-specific) subunit beta, partial [Gammaproteobacteria bacterium]
MSADQIISLLIILGIKRMSSPVTARSGIQWAGVGVLVAVIATFFHHGTPGHVLIENAALIFIATALSTALAWYSGKKVAMTDMPQMVALYNGMGGGSAAAIGASALLAAGMQTHFEHSLTTTQTILAVVGALIGSVSFTGSLIAFAKLQGLMDKTFRFSGQQLVNGLCFLAAVVFGALVVWQMQT